MVLTLLLCTSSYGGPGSQTASASFGIDWHAYLACGLQYVIVVVDGRGTGYKGRSLRNPVKGNLGFWEVRDQVNAARCVRCRILERCPSTNCLVFLNQPLGSEGLC
jgi:Prolyl oligopeptidase family